MEYRHSISPEQMSQESAGFLTHFSPNDSEWLIDNGKHRQVLAAQSVCDPDDAHPQLLLVLEGSVGIYRNMAGGQRQFVTSHGPGELVGEAEWLTSEAGADQIVAEEPSILLWWPPTVLEERLVSRPEFAAMFYKAIAAIGVRRGKGRDAEGPNAQHVGQGRIAFSDDPALNRLGEQMSSFKELIGRADRLALRSKATVLDLLTREAEDSFQQLMNAFNDVMTSDGNTSEATLARIGAEIQREFLPYLSLTETADRFYAKPRGYAGDYLTIAKIYDNKPGGSGRVGPLIDACFLATPAANAVRNRRSLLRRLIHNAVADNGDRPTLVASLACGPAQEIFDIYGELEHPDRLHASLIDIDLQALAHVSEMALHHKIESQIRVFNQNLLYLVTGRQKLDLPAQDLIYSIGLIDYFGDKFVVQLLNYVHDSLSPGGAVVLGNFHPRNPNKAFMDHILEWKLIHRDEEDMNRLFRASKFGKAADVIHFEGEGINLFAQCHKPRADILLA